MQIHKNQFYFDLKLNMFRILFIRLLPAFILILTIQSVIANSDFQFGNTFLWWVVAFIILGFFWLNKGYFIIIENTSVINVVEWYLIWMAFSLIRGAFIADNYWGWKGLIGNMFSLFLPIVIYVLVNEGAVSFILRSYLKYTLPLFIFLFPFISKGAYGWYLMPVSILLLFLPLISIRKGIVLFLIMLLVIFADLSARSNVIKFGFPFILLSFYLFRDFFTRNTKILELFRVVLMFLPVIMLLLALTGVFNIFKMQDYIGGDYTVKKQVDGTEVQESLVSDTRSDLWKEVLLSAYNNNYWLIGRSPARGNDSELYGAESEMLFGRKERLANEVAITNIFTWTGIIGVFLYMLVFWRASYWAINKSKNFFVKIMGLYLAFRWSYAWIEDRPSFSIGYLSIWILIGLCLSYSFRNMTDNDIKSWAHGIFPSNFLFGKSPEERIMFDKR